MGGVGAKENYLLTKRTEFLKRLLKIDNLELN